MNIKQKVGLPVLMICATLCLSALIANAVCYQNTTSTYQYDQNCASDCKGTAYSEQSSGQDQCTPSGSGPGQVSNTQYANAYTVYYWNYNCVKQSNGSCGKQMSSQGHNSYAYTACRAAGAACTPPSGPE